MAVALEEALSRLRADPGHPVTMEVDGLVIEMRVQRESTANDIFEKLGPWEGETEEELLELLRDSREQGGSKPPPDPF